MNVYLIVTIVLLIAAAVYFLFFFKGGAKKYFNRTLVAIDAHKKKSLPASTPKTSLRARLPMLNKGKLMTTSDEENPIIDFGEEANVLLNDILNNISNKLCNKDSTNKFPMPSSKFNSLLLVKNIYESNKFTTEEKEDYLASLSLIDNNNFLIENEMVKLTNEEYKKLAKFFMPSLDISNDVLLTFDQFKNINYGVITALFNAEKFVKINNIIENNTLPIMNLEEPNEEASPPGLFDLLIAQQLISGKKLSDEEKARINIYIFSNQQPDYELFKNDDVLNNLFTKLTQIYGDITTAQKTKILVNISTFLSINDMFNENKLDTIIENIANEMVIDQPDDVKDLMKSEIISRMKSEIISGIDFIKAIFTMPPICELI